MKIRLCSLVLIFLVCSYASAYDFYVKDKNGVNIYYNILSSEMSNRTVEVTASPEGYTRAVTIPSTVTYSAKKYKVVAIGDKAFFVNQSVPSVTIPESVEFIGSDAFHYCTKLSELVLPNSVKNIGSNAFASLYSMEQVICNDKIFAYYPIIPGHEYEVPDGITTISYGAFAEALNLRKIILPETVTSIDDNNFVSGRAFLESLVVKATTPPECTDKAFSDSYYENLNVYVSDADPSILEAYQAHPVWGKIKNLAAIDLGGGKPAGDVNNDGVVNVTDVVEIYNYIMIGEESGVAKSDADINSDGDVNVSDVVAVYNYIVGN